ncbi:MAG: hypothetical protein KAT71_06350 [Gammaproteobacteria bacterium]|nr:hypothetical protein [Gammaproteobacteria bacterium]
MFTHETAPELTAAMQALEKALLDLKLFLNGGFAQQTSPDKSTAAYNEILTRNIITTSFFSLTKNLLSVIRIYNARVNSGHIDADEQNALKKILFDTDVSSFFGCHLSPWDHYSNTFMANVFYSDIAKINPDAANKLHNVLACFNAIAPYQNLISTNINALRNEKKPASPRAAEATAPVAAPLEPAAAPAAVAPDPLPAGPPEQAAAPTANREPSNPACLHRAFAAQDIARLLYQQLETAEDSHQKADLRPLDTTFAILGALKHIETFPTEQKHFNTLVGCCKKTLAESSMRSAPKEYPLRRAIKDCKIFATSNGGSFFDKPKNTHKPEGQPSDRCVIA